MINKRDALAKMNMFRPMIAKFFKFKKHDSVMVGVNGMVTTSSALKGSDRADQSNRTTKVVFTLVKVLIALFISGIAVSSTYTISIQSRDIQRSSSNPIEALNNARGGIYSEGIAIMRLSLTNRFAAPTTTYSFSTIPKEFHGTVSET